MGRPGSTRPWSKAFSNSLTRIRTETFCAGLKNPQDISTLPSPPSSVTTQKINPISPWLHVSWQSYTSGGTHPSQAQRERLGHLRGSPPRAEIAPAPGGSSSKRRIHVERKKVQLLNEKVLIAVSLGKTTRGVRGQCFSSFQPSLFPSLSPFRLPSPLPSFLNSLPSSLPPSLPFLPALH